MAEPEDVIAEGALHATRLVRELWSRHRAGQLDPRPSLRDLKRRLELFLGAVFPDAPELGVAEPPAPRSWLARLAQRSTAHLHHEDAIAASNGERILLPADLHHIPAKDIPDRYRLLALEQGARVARGTHRHRPDGDALLCDLYLLAEAAAVDWELVRLFPRMASSLSAARKEALMLRPAPGRLRPRELAVEDLLRALLEAHPAHPPESFIASVTPAGSLAWARAAWSGVSTQRGPYRGIAPVSLWGVVALQGSAVSSAAGDDDVPLLPPGRIRPLPRRPRIRDAASDEDDTETGTWMVRADDLQEKAEDPAGLTRPADRDQDADTGELADALSELPELRLVRTPGPVTEVLAGEETIPRTPSITAMASETGLAYPEWDWRAGAYQPGAAVVHERVASAGPDGWVKGELRRHAATIRAVRRDFERLRPRRMALRRQPDGAELDIDALVAARADSRAGQVTDARWYIDSRPVRRDAAIALLVDVSASTDGWVAGDRRIIDVEKEALLIVSEALAALGDPNGIFSFASAGPSRVSMEVIKDFPEGQGLNAVRRRIAGLEPDGFTRVGAALRHTTAALMRQPARHRLLLLLSDGKPNDIDEYEGRYGVEDARMAVAEARLQGLYVFCLTVDRQAPRYATRIFGRDYAVLSRAERLPAVLTTLLRQLIGS